MILVQQRSDLDQATLDGLRIMADRLCSEYPYMPADKAMQYARDRIRQITERSRLLLAPEQIVADLNRFLGWAAHFRYGNSAARFDKISEYARICRT